MSPRVARWHRCSWRQATALQPNRIRCPEAPEPRAQFAASGPCATSSELTLPKSSSRIQELAARSRRCTACLAILSRRRKANATRLYGRVIWSSTCVLLLQYDAVFRGLVYANLCTSSPRVTTDDVSGIQRFQAAKGVSSSCEKIHGQQRLKLWSQSCARESA